MPLTLVSYSTSYAIAQSVGYKLFASLEPLVLYACLHGLVSGGLVGLAQWYLLSPIVQKSRIWFLSVLTAETLGGAVRYGICVAQLSSNMNFSLSLLIASSVGGAISGLITGRFMLRLLSLKRVQ